MRLLYLENSPYSRAVLVLLDELGLEFEAIEVNTEQGQALRPPTHQSPCLLDGAEILWDSPLIADYLLRQYGPGEAGGLAPTLIRPEREWADRRLLAALQTFCGSVALMAQMRFTGINQEDNRFLMRNVDRLPGLLDLFEDQLGGNGGGLLGDRPSFQDILLVCFLDYVDNRPLDLHWREPARPKLLALFDALKTRPSFDRNGLGKYVQSL